MTSSQVEKRTAPVAAVEQYTAEFAKVLPDRMPAEMFSRLAVGALRRSPDLMAAASKNLPSFLTALMAAAKLGLEPGSEEFWLVPRGGKQPGVLGLVGWKGEIELILRTGAVRSVASEVVREKDRFRYQPGQGLPTHEIDWFGDRGAVIGAWACAEMTGGGWSRAAIVGPVEIERAMAASATSGSSHSPWKTDYAAMVQKTAVHRLADWVPTSPEYRREVLRASMDVAAEQRTATATVVQPAVDPPRTTDEAPAHDPTEPVEVLDVELVAEVPEILTGPPAAKTQVDKIKAQIGELGRIDGQPWSLDKGMGVITALAGIEGGDLRSPDQLTAAQAATVIAALDRAIGEAFEQDPAVDTETGEIQDPEGAQA